MSLIQTWCCIFHLFLIYCSYGVYLLISESSFQMLLFYPQNLLPHLCPTFPSSILYPHSCVHTYVYSPLFPRSSSPIYCIALYPFSPLHSFSVAFPSPPPPCQHALHLFDARHHYHKAACQYVVSLNAMQIQKKTEVLEKMVRCVISLHALLTALPAAPTLFHLSNQHHCHVCHSECLV